MAEQLKDSGARIDYGEGKAVREPSTGKGRFDLISPYTIYRLIDSMSEENNFPYRNMIFWDKHEIINLVYRNLYDLSKTCSGYRSEKYDHFDYLAFTLYIMMQLYELENNGSYFYLKDEDEYLPVVPPTALKAIARHYEQGAEKYAEFNWARGIPMSRCLDSALRHFGQYQMGLTDEPHLAASMWNVAALMHYEVAMPSMNNLHEWETDDKKDSSN